MKPHGPAQLTQGDAAPCQRIAQLRGLATLRGSGHIRRILDRGTHACIGKARDLLAGLLELVERGVVVNGTPLGMRATDPLPVPAYLEFFGFGTTTPDELRTVARVAY